METERDIKQVIVVRADLKMRRGKEIAQSCHASIAFLTNRLKDKNPTFSDVENKWIDDSFKKVCVRVDSEQELLDISKHAESEGLQVVVIKDSGLTEFKGVHTYTCLAIGPDYSDKIDKVTGKLRLY